MKWMVAARNAIFLFILIIVIVFVFNAAMKAQMEKWVDSDVALGMLPRLMVTLHMFLQTNILILAPIILIICFAGAFIVAVVKNKNPSLLKINHLK